MGNCICRTQREVIFEEISILETEPSMSHFSITSAVERHMTITLELLEDNGKVSL